MKKSHLPVKTCLVCGLPFTWRKKWARCWEEVRYCSERCRRERKPESPINPLLPTLRAGSSSAGKSPL